MGDFLRSSEIHLVELLVPSNISYEAVGSIGDCGWLQFKDLNQKSCSLERPFFKEIKKCDDLETILKYFMELIKKNEIISNDKTLFSLNNEKKYSLPLLHEIDIMDQTLRQLEKELKEAEKSEEALLQNINELEQLKCVLNNISIFFQDIDEFNRFFCMIPYQTTTWNCIPPLNSGVVLTEKKITFERSLWRMSRGNVILRVADIEEPIIEPQTCNKVFKKVFAAFFNGTALKEKVLSVCKGFDATVYYCPESFLERNQLKLNVEAQLKELKMIFKRTRIHTIELLGVVRDKYENCMFKYDGTYSVLIGEGWCLKKKFNAAKVLMEQVRTNTGNPTPIIMKMQISSEAPPTFFFTNKFTNPFQNIVDSYGIATYQELNPAFFSLSTFPFLFAVMFGDVGHGMLLVGFAFWLCMSEKKNKVQIQNEFYVTLFSGRYIVLLMGLFSIYTGLIYNDIFGKSLWIFKSSYSLPTGNISQESISLSTTKHFPLPISSSCPSGCGYSGNPYPFGIDPVWSLSGNKMAFMNSFKMKMSIIIGVLHMLFAISLNFSNHHHFSQNLKIYCETIPQFLFMFSLFGYLCILMIVKWLSSYPSLPNDASTIPSLLITFISMFLSPNEVSYVNHTQIYKGQTTVQKILLIVAMICVPWMLFSRSFILKYQQDQIRSRGYSRLEEGEEPNDLISLKIISEDDELINKEDNQLSNTSLKRVHIGSMLIEQSIHTVEFCLGAVSNTASYLRLWALSLAHAQLSEVLWTMILRPALNKNFLVLYFGFFIWSMLTVGILLIMEGMSAFLHALRLHWVEFQNKFYSASGYSFTPFYFKEIIQQNTKFQ